MESFCSYRGMMTTHVGLAYRCHHPDATKRYCILEGEPTSTIAVCDKCQIRHTPPTRAPIKPNTNWQYKTTADLANDALELCKFVPSNCKGIIGIPRSGIIPAAAVATHLHLPLYEVSKMNGVARIGSGIRFSERQKELEDGPFFVVDDSVHDGNTYWLIKQLLPTNSIIAAVYVKPESRHFIDHYVQEVQTPHLFEWNLFNTLMMSPLRETGCLDPFLGAGLALDFDGIISQDPNPGDDRSANLEWLLKLRPGKYMPRRCCVTLIATNRLEKWRAATEEWCDRWGVKFDKMVMSPYETVEDRDADFPNSAIMVKGEAYRNSQCNLFVESDPFQAELIFEYTGKPVLCPQSRRLFQQ